MVNYNKPPVLNERETKLLAKAKFGPEDVLATCVAKHIKKYYPGVDYRFDIAADLPMSPWKAAMIKAKYKHEISYPDLFVAEPMGDFHGLFIELKADRGGAYRVDGTLKQNKHILGQAHKLDLLTSKGYYTTFGWDNSFAILDIYLQNELGMLDPPFTLTNPGYENS